MSKNNIEIELRFPLKNADAVIARLNRDAIKKYENRQIDTYYNAPHRDFFARAPSVDDWLRLQNSDGKYSINLKSFFPKGALKSTHCDEYESGIENMEALEKIFAALDFKPVIRVDKKRIAFAFKNTEIAIDEVAELGTFIEVEYDCDDDCTIESAREYLYGIVKEIGADVGEEYDFGYAFDLMERQGLVKGWGGQ
ncbi:MAG: class IV adenylate cyclase [Alphaproteobacteria bacterium]|nr:class IV adenylate cyclase [Alphaproteobacteria bacterium]